jgi:hypothetical protein
MRRPLGSPKETALTKTREESTREKNLAKN